MWYKLGQQGVELVCSFIISVDSSQKFCSIGIGIVSQVKSIKRLWNLFSKGWGEMSTFTVFVGILTLQAWDLIKNNEKQL